VDSVETEKRERETERRGNERGERGGVLTFAFVSFLFSVLYALFVCDLGSPKNEKKKLKREERRECARGT
jgi:hypothetical protein